MNMTKTFKKVGVLAIVLLMIAALVGCGGNQEEKQWEEDVTAIMNDITLSQTDFNTALAGIQPGAYNWFLKTFSLAKIFQKQKTLFLSILHNAI